MARREGFLFRHPAGRQLREDAVGRGGVAEPEAADHDATVLGDDGAQRVAVPGRPLRRVRPRAGLHDRWLAGAQIHVG